MQIVPAGGERCSKTGGGRADAAADSNRSAYPPHGRRMVPMSGWHSPGALAPSYPRTSLQSQKDVVLCAAGAVSPRLYPLPVNPCCARGSLFRHVLALVTSPAGHGGRAAQAVQEVAEGVPVVEHEVAHAQEGQLLQAARARVQPERALRNPVGCTQGSNETIVDRCQTRVVASPDNECEIQRATCGREGWAEASRACCATVACLMPLIKQPGAARQGV